MGLPSKEELDTFYLNHDPWGFASNPDDAKRKKEILSCIPYRHERALDIGCGEGWITKDIWADEIHGLELSGLAASRCPKNVHIVLEPWGMYDLILACGVLYRHYDYKRFLKLIKEHGSGLVITCNIESWEVGEVKEIGKEVHTHTFPYRQYTQRLRVFEIEAPAQDRPQD